MRSVSLSKKTKVSTQKQDASSSNSPSEGAGLMCFVSPGPITQERSTPQKTPKKNNMPKGDAEEMVYFLLYAFTNRMNS